MIVVLMVAAGAPWETAGLAALSAHPGVVVLKRCVDVDDLLASAASGQADVAVVGVDARGLDVAAVDHLRRHGVRTVAVADGTPLDTARTRAGRIGVAGVADGADPSGLVALVTAPAPPGSDPAARTTLPGSPGPPPGPQPGPASGLPLGPPPAGPPEAGWPGPAAPTTSGRTPGSVTVVWGPAGAPGRSTVAAAMAAELARAARSTLLVDADPYGGTIAQQLGILDEVSGLLAATRLSAAGQLEDRFASVQRGLGEHLAVVTGLPRPDRWVEVRDGTVEHVLELGRAQGEVVVDTGFSLEDDATHAVGARPGRNHLTLAALDVADRVVVVGAADPVGLSRLARALVELHELSSARPGAAGALAVHVVVNRMRPSLGWSEKDIAGMVSGFTRLRGLHFLPDDRADVDRALVAGRSLLESGDSPLVRGVAALVEATHPAPADAHRAGRAGRPGLRRRTAGRARPR